MSCYDSTEGLNEYLASMENFDADEYLNHIYKDEIVDLYIDIETYSSVDITKSGVYKYVQSLDFEILILCYKINDGEIKTVDLASGESLPYEFIYLMNSPSCRKHAHNAAFERLCFEQMGLKVPIWQWHCSAVKAAYCGLPLSLGDVSKALNLGEAAKDAEGKALIRYFSIPVKATKINGGRTRNLPTHNPEKWEKYKLYCKQDVHAEYTMLQMLSAYELPESEQQMYILDQEINDRGIKIDITFAKNAVKVDQKNTFELTKRLKEITGLSNPGSPAQLKTWLSSNMGKEVKSLTKDDIPVLMQEAGRGSAAYEVLDLRKKLAKTSVKKYMAMLACVCDDGRAHGLFQFYGANRTGRWAGRLIQLQNLPQNKFKKKNKITGFDEINHARELVREGNYEGLYLSYDDIGSVLSQLVRTAFIPEEGNIFAVADFKAIEARVIAWLASEPWRLEVFKSHGMIYEASASQMFNVPIASIRWIDEEGVEHDGPNIDMRAKGKVAELALGYQGGVGAMINMGGDKMGLTKNEMKAIVKAWREANPNIVELWEDMEKNAILAIKKRKEQISDYRGIKFNYDGNALTITLPSGRSLFYQKPSIVKEMKYEIKRKDPDSDEILTGWLPLGRILTSDIKTGRTWEVEKIMYWGMDQVKKIWTRIDTYGGKLVENIIQAIARDILADSMKRLNNKGYKCIAHIHDEVIVEIFNFESERTLIDMCDIMGQPIPWTENLPLGADGFTTTFYKKG